MSVEDEDGPARKRPPPCGVPMCLPDPKHSRFILPKDPILATKWLNALRIEEVPERRFYVCEAHFDKTCINKYLNNRKHLEKGSVPLPRSVSTMEYTLDSLKSITEVPVAVQPVSKVENPTVDNRESITGYEIPVTLTSLPVFNIDYRTPDNPETTAEYVVPDTQPPNQGPYTDFVADIIVNSLNLTSPPNDKNTNPPSSVLVQSLPTSNKRKLQVVEKQHDVESLKMARIQVTSPALLSETASKNTDFSIKAIVKLQKRMELMFKFPKLAKELALKIHLTYPQAYQVLRKTLSLPNVLELKSIFDDCSILTDTLFANSLRYKANIMSERQKQCFICLGEIEVQEHLYYDLKWDTLLGISDINESQTPELACKALVLTVQSLFADWKQPVAIAYIGTNADIQVEEWISRNITNLLDIGFSIKAFVSKSDFQNLPIVPPMSPIYDIPSLFQLFYHNFLTHEYVFSGGTAKMQDIVDYYKIDSKKLLRLTPKLTKKHINRNRLQNIDIKLVTDVINMNTATAISTYIHFNALDKSAMYTVTLIAEMNALFEVLCDNTCNENVKRAPREKHIQFLRKMLTFFHNLKIINVDTMLEVPKAGTFVDKMQATIKSIINLYKNIEFSSDSENLPVQRFSLDDFREFTAKIKKLEKNSTRPTCKEVHSAFRQSSLLNILKPTNKNKSLDLETALDQINDTVMYFDSSWQKVTCASIGAGIKIETSEYNTLDLKKKDAVVLIAGFLLKKCNDYHADCAAMKNYTCIVLHDTSSICKTILNEIQQGVCVVPQESFIEFVEMMEIRFRSFMTKSTLETKKGKLMNGLLTSMQYVNFPMPCECFPILYAKKLYSRLRIYNMLKHNNGLISSGQCKNELVVNNF